MITSFSRTWTREEFRAFLQDNPTRIFKTCLVNECPLALFLREKFETSVEVNRHIIFARVDSETGPSIDSVNTEKWEYDFVSAVDASSPYTSVQDISGEKALGILDAIDNMAVSI